MTETLAKAPIIPQKPRAGWYALHGVLYLILAVGFIVLVPAVRPWPWFWIAPLAAYYLFVAGIPGLRRSFVAPRPGTVTPWLIAATVAISVVAAITLVVFHTTMKPDVRMLAGTLPVKVLGLVATGIVFSLFNAILEEVVFRNVLFDSVAPRFGPWWALAVTTVLFGLGHKQGYPPGTLGMLLSGIYGASLAWLRIASGGLALPIASHIVADATIYMVLTKEGAL